MDDTFYIIPNTIYRCYPIPTKFENVKLRSVYKYKIDDTKVRLLIILTADLQPQTKTILQMLRREVSKKKYRNFSLNLDNIYINFILDGGKLYGPEYFFIIPSDDEDDANRFICDHGYWNLQDKSDLDITLTEYNKILNTNSKIVTHMEDTTLHGNAIRLDKENNCVIIGDETIHL